MTEPDYKPIYAEVGDGWSYRIDATAAPAYVVVTQKGAATNEVFQQTLAELVRVMDEVMGEGQRFCPFIVDLRGAAPGRIGIPSGQQSMKAIQKRVSRAVIIIDSGQHDLLLGFLTLISKLLPDLDVVHTMEEALAKLGVSH